MPRRLLPGVELPAYLRYRYITIIKGSESFPPRAPGSSRMQKFWADYMAFAVGSGTTIRSALSAPHRPCRAGNTK